MTLTDRAAEHVKKFLKTENAEGLRVSVKPTGCSGYSYVVDTVESFAENDQTFKSKGIKIIVGENSIEYLKGTELDYVREGLNEGFKFNNPNVAETCGCGESFTIDE
ncbi:MAG: HesB/IscA family protein [Gammaproteobacteria bacterium]